MRNKIVGAVIWIVIILAVAWAFDAGMKKQHNIDCQAGHFCN